MCMIAIFGLLLTQAFASSHWRPTEEVSCDLLQLEKGSPDFTVDVRLDPVITYQGDKLKEKYIYFYVKINGDRLVRDAWDVPPCNRTVADCRQFFHTSTRIGELFEAAVQRARNGVSTQLRFDFMDTTANITLVRTRMCGDFVFNYDSGMWEFLDFEYICAHVILLAPYKNEGHVPRCHEQKRRYSRHHLDIML
ncbi:unnamed protein product, partial [Mesorhabditis spiculigera]